MHASQRQSPSQRFGIRCSTHRALGRLLACALVAAFGFVGCNEHALAPYAGTVDRAGNDTFTQHVLRAVDILFVVDNSSSMCEEQIALQTSFDRFIAVLADARIDFRLAVTTTDMVDLRRGLGQLQRSPGSFERNLASCSAQLPDLSHCSDALPSGFLTASDYALGAAEPNRAVEVQRLQRDFGCMALTGIDGDPTEMGFGAVIAALSNPEFTQEFRRPGALLAVVFVSDENDCTDGTRGALQGPVYALGDEGCELNRNIEDACLYAAQDTWDASGRLVPYAGGELSWKDQSKPARQWCVDGDRDAVAALSGALELDCGPTGCSSLLVPRLDVYDALVHHLREINGYDDDATAARDLIIATIINPDGGIRYSVGEGGPTSWCGAAGTQGYRYQALAEMVASDRRVVAPICDLGSGLPVDFAEPLTGIATTLVSAISETCLSAPPMTCKPGDLGPDGTCLPGGQCCPEGQQCSRVFFEGTEIEYHLCSGFRIDVQQTTQSGELVDLVAGQDFDTDFESVSCLRAMGSPLRLVFTNPPASGSQVSIDYPAAVVPLYD